MNDSDQTPRIGVLTSGGDAPGMNAVLRAVVRGAIRAGAAPYAIHEGYRGAVAGGDLIRPIAWDDVGSIQHRGGTVIGTARSAEFRSDDGQARAALALAQRGIDRLVAIGGDGTFRGLAELSSRWPDLLRGADPDLAARHPVLRACGVPASIDNDLAGTDTMVGVDSALHRIVDAIDALSSTAASHHRSFVIEVMGRNCGYPALLAAVAGGCDYVFVPERPPPVDWRDRLCDALSRGREAGRRDSLVVVAEGARDSEGTPIRSGDVKEAITTGRGEDARVTILGHVQRGGGASAYDRCLGTVLGWQAVEVVLDDKAAHGPLMVGISGNRVVEHDLVTVLADDRAAAIAVEQGDQDAAISGRGATFARQLETFMAGAHAPRSSQVGGRRVAIMHVGGLAPGMNSALRAVVRLGVASGLEPVGVQGGVPGLLKGALDPLSWEQVDRLTGEGGAQLGTNRKVPTAADRERIAAMLAEHQVEGLILIGGLNALLTAETLTGPPDQRLGVPIVVLPASIDNNVAGTELTVGADTAICDAVYVLDRIKQSASASRRCFVAETMGRRCGYLTTMAGLASGAERVYLHEDGVTLARLERDLERMHDAFRGGRRLFLAVRNEAADERFSTDVIAKLLEEEAGDLYDVRTSVIGHMQQGGAPTPFDRILATRMADSAVSEVRAQFEAGTSDPRLIAYTGGQMKAVPLADALAGLDREAGRPREQWWFELSRLIGALAFPPADTAG